MIAGKTIKQQHIIILFNTNDMNTVNLYRMFGTNMKWKKKKYFFFWSFLSRYQHSTLLRHHASCSYTLIPSYLFPLPLYTFFFYFITHLWWIYVLLRMNLLSSPSPLRHQYYYAYSGTSFIFLWFFLHFQREREINLKSGNVEKGRFFYW